ncbi:coiled-coil domain-containing protein 122 [Latimeria chalumnae]|uniref:coiled-coil domain-containing protein 122 n=1 Tax=Latimeria chalumnae TaxID=7897 RepID=UPI00313DDEA7
MDQSSSPLSLSEFVKAVAQQQQVQASETEKNKQYLRQLQTQLSELEKQKASVTLELKATTKQIYFLEEDIENKNKHCEKLESDITAVYGENVRLKLIIETEEENLEKLLLEYGVYRRKMETHKELISEVESKKPIMTELVGGKKAVEKLKAKKEELRMDLQNPEGNMIKQVQREIADLKAEIAAMKETINEQAALLLKEEEVHAQLKKDIEVQNRRCEAILKRLHCQLNKAQSNKRQWNWDIQQMEKTVSQLRRSLGIVE